MYKFYPHPFEGCVNIESILDSLQKIKGYLKHLNTMYRYMYISYTLWKPAIYAYFNS